MKEERNYNMDLTEDEALDIMRSRRPGPAAWKMWAGVVYFFAVLAGFVTMEDIIHPWILVGMAAVLLVGPMIYMMYFYGKKEKKEDLIAIQAKYQKV